MKKLINGIIEFRKKKQPTYKDFFARLALEQKPDALFIACSDSRMAVNVFASTDPGDLFVIRNVGNMIPACSPEGVSLNDLSEVAAIEFALNALNVKDIIVCGHSECGAMIAILDGKTPENSTHLISWLKNGQETLELMKKNLILDSRLAKHNQISQLNVLLQMEHIQSHPSVKARVSQGQLRIHGWWFDIAQAEVLYYNQAEKKFSLIDESHYILSTDS